MRRWLMSGLVGAFVLAGPAWSADVPPGAFPPGGPPGANSCTGCHSGVKVADVVIPRIAGRKAEEIVTFMREYRSGAWPSSVMGRIAKGFDDQQIDAIAAWFAAQPE